MCGISGFISSKLSKDNLACMVSSLAHRGPDAKGIYFENIGELNIGLGHNRLSILDLSSEANQPMESHCGRYTIVYNGEVYNFLDLRSKLPDHVWKTSGDTEVILECFAAYGVSCLPWFNGMFAFAIWDKLERRLYISRDRIGIKPLFYFVQGNEFAFASELKGLQSLNFKHQLNLSAVANFLYLGYIPKDQTIYADCFKLFPGHYAIVSQEGIENLNPYWTLEENIEPSVQTDEILSKGKLKELLENAVSKSMISDVPLGILLSGGVDSSLVAAIAQKISKCKVKTFSIAFEEGRYDETKYAQQVADHIGSEHRKFTVNEEEGIKIIESFLDIYDEPYGDMSGIPGFLVSQLARQEVTVALCGDGADELFMGYGSYTWAKRLQNPIVKLTRPVLQRMLYHFDKNKFRNRSFLFDYKMENQLGNIFSQSQGNWSIKELAGLLKYPSEFSFEESLNKTARQLSPAELQSFFDLKNYLPEDLLTKMDRASMQHGLEVRVPFLDNDVINFALNLSPSLKYKGKTQKYLLKEVLYEYAPREFFDRPKWGFAVPMQEWLSGKLSYLIDDYLSIEKIEQGGLLNPSVVQGYVRKFRAGETFRYHRIWLLIVLQKWLLEKKHSYILS
ncbi:MAG: asparagine synthase (glutamine-hydrolyzing) [Chitinophagaceae bacterium]